MKNSEEKRVVFLEGEKVNFRPLSETDVPDFIRWINDPEVRDFIGNTFPLHEHQEKEWIKKLGSDDKNVVLGIETKDGKLIGNMGIHRINWVDRTCTMGAVIGEKEYWGKGFGTDAKMYFLNYIFNTLNLRKVCSDALTYNKRSLEYNLHCGYKVEGTKKKHVFKKGKYWDLVGLAVFKEDWLPIWRKYKKTGKVR